jgi:8-oxo-dGTP pyrophosphatase MutT (NUDIX family)
MKRNESARFMPGVWVFPGGAVDPGEGADEAGYRACAIRELAEEAGIELPEDAELILFSRWITPEVISTRFDARFYLARAPAHTTPRPDGEETTEGGWFTPQAALERQAADRMPLAFPTVRQLEGLREFAGAQEAIAAHRGRPVEPILPKVIGTMEEHRVVLPGDPDYPV